MLACAVAISVFASSWADATGQIEPVTAVTADADWHCLLQMNVQVSQAPLTPRQNATTANASASDADLPILKNASLNPAKLAWLHIPKTGSSFANVLVTWACTALPDDVYVGNQVSWDYADTLSREATINDFNVLYKPQCAGLHVCGAHDPLDRDLGRDPQDFFGCRNATSLENHTGQFVGMFRQPEQRILSGYYHDFHDYSHEIDPHAPPTLLQYAAAVQGCSVHMMTGRSCGSAAEIKQEDLDLAVGRLYKEFVFVGITEEYNMTVCLFHAMFGGEVHPREFLNIRPGRRHKEVYDTSHLYGYTDEWDRKLYYHAKRIFESNVQRFGITRESCDALVQQASEPPQNM